VSRLTLAALILEAAFGYPEPLHRRAPHPVTGLGAAISALDRRWNRPERSEGARKASGIATLALVAGGAALAGAVAERILRGRCFGPGALALLATTGLAQRSLYDHVAAVRDALARGDLPGAREAVGRIVGRDVAALDESGVAAAALESLAESFNDGVAAPAFWLAAGGLPGLFAYKAVNTADSMIGHMEPQWRSFGWASARADDVMNLAPARLAGALIAIAGGRGWRAMVRDAPKHASPNAGWPEAALAGALGVQLGGPARYDGEWVERPVFGDGPPPTAADLDRGLKLYVKACGLLWLLAAGASACRR
jgi:adenosylcobinamide-phosphate synthase